MNPEESQMSDELENISQEEAQEKLNLILTLCEEIGWITFVAKNHEGAIEGIMAGTEEYVNEFTNSRTEPISSVKQDEEENEEEEKLAPSGARFH